MSGYKIETHMHTVHTSACAHLEAAALADGYAKAGFAAVAVTDHYNRDTFRYLHIDITRPGDMVTPFLEGWRRMVEECSRRGVKVYKGAELRFDECGNDYLLYNYPDELLSDPEKIFRMGIAAFAPAAHEAGALIIQAHPYRRRCTPAFACYIDGVEVQNRNLGHENHNARAAEYAEQFGLLRTGGSDCHCAGEIGRGGIVAPSLPEDDAAFARLLREGGYTIIGSE